MNFDEKATSRPGRPGQPGEPAQKELPQKELPQKDLPRIRRLPDHLVNQIAAGEVVERPASVVKELVENSLDGGATKIEILLTDGGIAEIGVIDNGAGIGPEDLELAIERHATSKLRDAADLEAIGTFGFRGEALASIASVSEMEIKSRTAGMEHANRLILCYGEKTEGPRPVGAPVGTGIFVRRLFERVPARQKFLRSFATEFSHISRMVRELALGNPHCAFYLHHQGKRVAQYVQSTREGRFRECLKPDWEPLQLEEESADLSLECFLSPPNVVQDRGELFLFINGRGVRNRGLLAAVRNSYASALGPHHDPTGVVYLDIRRDWVDVNVHPQKLEVRCVRQDNLYGWIQTLVKKAIASHEARPATPVETAPYRPKAATPPRHEPFREAAHPTVFQTKRPPPVASPLPSSQPRLEIAPRRLRYLAQLQCTYLVCEDEDGLVLLDQHALHEKLRFEELQRHLGAGKLPAQALLLPKVIRLPRDLMPVLEENKEALSRVGLELEVFGDGDVAVKTRPAPLEEKEVETVIVDTLLGLREGVLSQNSSGEARDRALRPLLATIACHSVVRAGQALERAQAEALLEGLGKLEMGWTCPHGRPVAFRIGYPQIAKHFKS